MRLTGQQHMVGCLCFFIRTPGARSNPFAMILAVRDQVMALENRIATGRAIVVEAMAVVIVHDRVAVASTGNDIKA